MKKKQKNSLHSKNWSRENLQWAAGFLEGEGCFYSKETTRNNKPRIVLVLNATQHERSKDVLERLKTILGGNIRGPYANSGRNNKKGQDKVVEWTTGSYKYVYAICVALYPFMSFRRKLAIEKILFLFKKC